MKRLIFALALALSVGVTYAKDMAKAEWPNISITLTNEKCDNPKMVKVHKDRGMRTPISELKRARIVYHGRTLEGCWADLESQGMGVGVVDEEGDSGLIDKDQFKPISSV